MQHPTPPPAAAGRAQGYRPGTFTPRGCPRSHRQEVSVQDWADKEAQGYTLPRSTFTHVYNQDRVKPWSDGLERAAEARAMEARGPAPDWGGRRALPPLSPRQSLLGTLAGGEAFAPRMSAGLYASPERNFGAPREFVPSAPREFAGRTYNTFAQRFRVQPPAARFNPLPGEPRGSVSARAGLAPVASAEGRHPLPLTAGKTGWSRSDHRF
jgi:hypothetical protein